MVSKTIIVLTTVFALIAIGGGVGYYIANHDVSDESDGYTSSEIDQILQKYADNLRSKGGAIGCNGAKHTIKAGTDVRVENGAPVYDYHTDPFNATYYIPYHGIEYVYINI